MFNQSTSDSVDPAMITGLALDFSRISLVPPSPETSDFTVAAAEDLQTSV